MDFTEESYKSFQLFNTDWALITAGPMNDCNTMVVSWGELGTIWGKRMKGRPVATVFVHPERFTSEFLKKYEQFTISFYDKRYLKALGYLGSHSGRDGDKIKASGLTPVAMGGGVTFQEAKLTFLCKKIYFHQLSKDALAQEIKDYYAGMPDVYPNVTPDGTDDDWEPHYAVIGEIIDARGSSE